MHCPIGKHHGLLVKVTRSAALSGRFRWVTNPGLKAWAMVSNRFAVKSDGLLGYLETQLRC